MDKEEFKEKISQIKKEYTLKENEICIEYLVSNDHYNVGDIIRDRRGCIKIKSVNFAKPLFPFEIFGVLDPSLIYIGDCLTNQGDVRQVMHTEVLEKVK